ncbi:hypothetical protein AAFF_G00097500 [Aldrovandia affinis]|uniref:Uncharacterized protein n=1 Tax=Aldrovandia affinis TaxID=143900 RepID=A0AAD7R1H0_9TELE|nr:hypothetical protein AAFF_G00097500 [Aldrovandia affinis]
MDSPDKELLRTIHAEIATLSGGVLFDDSKYLSDVQPSETRKRTNIVSAPNESVVKRRFGDVLTPAIIFSYKKRNERRHLLRQMSISTK